MADVPVHPRRNREHDDSWLPSLRGGRCTRAILEGTGNIIIVTQSERWQMYRAILEGTGNIIIATQSEQWQMYRAILEGTGNMKFDFRRKI